MISQGIGRGNYSNLDPKGKIQMSKVKPIKLSTTPFYAQPSKSGWRSYLLGMGKAWRSNSNLGGHPFLESVFQVKAWEGMPKPLCTHDFHLSPILMDFWLPHATGGDKALSSTVWLLFSSLLHTQNEFWVLLGKMGRKGPQFWGLRRPFLPQWASWDLPSRFSAFSQISPS